MNGYDDTDRTLEDWFASTTVGRAPDRMFVRTFEVTRAARQDRRWPRWVSRGHSDASLPRFAVLGLAAFLVVILGVGTFLVGSILLTRPERVAVSPTAVVTDPVAATCAHPNAVVVAAGSIWVSCFDQARRFDLSTGTVTAAIGSVALAADAAGAWAATDVAVESLDPADGTPTKTVPVDGVVSIALDRANVWSAQGRDHALVQIDRASGTVVSTIPMPDAPGVLATDGTDVWVTLPSIDQVVRVSAATGTVSATVEVAPDPASIAIANGRVWILDRLATTLTVIDPTSAAATRRTFRASEGMASQPAPTPGPGESSGGFAVIGDAVWEVAGAHIVETDAATGDVRRILQVTIPSNARLSAIAVDGSGLLVVDASRPQLLRVHP